MPTLCTQLGLTDKKTAPVLGAPAEYIVELEKETGAPKITQSVRGKTCDWLQVFVLDAKELDSALASALSHLSAGGTLWLSYPKASARKFTGAPKRAEILGAVAALGLQSSRSVSLNDQFTALCCILPSDAPSAKITTPESTAKVALPAPDSDADCAKARLTVTAQGYPAITVDPGLTFDDLHLLLAKQIKQSRADGPYAFEKSGMPIDLPKWAHYSPARIHRNAHLTKLSSATGEVIYQFSSGNKMEQISLTIENA